MNLDSIKNNTKWEEAANSINSNFNKTNLELTKIAASSVKHKGYFTTEAALLAAQPSPKVGDNAYVGATYPGMVYICNTAGMWTATTTVPSPPAVTLSEYYKKTETDAIVDAVESNITSLKTDLNETKLDTINLTKYPDKYQQDNETYLIDATFDTLFIKESPILNDGILTTLKFAQQILNIFNTQLAICEKGTTMKILRIYDIVVDCNILDLTHLNITVSKNEYIGLISKNVNGNSLYKIKILGETPTWGFTLSDVIVGNSSSVKVPNNIEYDYAYYVEPYLNTLKTHIDKLEYNVDSINSEIGPNNRLEDNFGDLMILKNKNPIETIKDGYSILKTQNQIIGLNELLINVYTKESGSGLYPVEFESNDANGEYGIWVKISDYNILRIHLYTYVLGNFIYVDFLQSELLLGAYKNSSISEISFSAEVIEISGDYCYIKVIYTSSNSYKKVLIPYDFGSGGNILYKQYQMLCYIGPSNPYNLKRKISIDSIVNKSVSKLENVRLYLPNNLICEIGIPLYIFKNSISDSFNYKNYNIQVLLSANQVDGYDYDRYWVYVPQSVGTVTATFKLYNNSRVLLDSKTLLIKSVNRTTQPTELNTVLFIGDSLTYYNRLTDEFYRILTSSDLQKTVADTISIYNVIKPAGRAWGNIQLIGTQKINYKGWTGQTVHEGRSGWAWSDFIGSSSPFYNNGILNFNNYLTVNGFTQPNIVYIGLGWNDTRLVIGEIYDVSAIINNARTFLTEITNEWPTTQIRLWTENIPGIHGGIGNHPYGSTEWADEQRAKKIMLIINESYKNFETEFLNVKVIGTTSQIDSEYALQEGKTNVNSRIAFEEIRGIDYVHPSDAGFFQIADSLIADFCDFLG